MSLPTGSVPRTSARAPRPGAQVFETRLAAGITVASQRVRAPPPHHPTLAADGDSVLPTSRSDGSLSEHSALAHLSSSTSSSTSLWRRLNVQLGGGALALVELVEVSPEFASKHGISGTLAAAKIIAATASNRNPHSNKVKRETVFYKLSCEHPSIIRYLKLKEDLKQHKTTIIMEYMNLKSLANVAVRVQQSPSPSARAAQEDHTAIARAVGVQVLAGLHYLHVVEGMMHRDIKEHNVLVNTSGRVKICDFDTSRPVVLDAAAEADRAGHIPEIKADTVAGTDGYMAPEVVRAEPCDSSCDVWSFAAMLFAFVASRQPYIAHECVFETSFAARIPFDRIDDAHLRDLLRWCLVDNPKQRPTALEALHHPFFTYKEQPLFDSQATLMEASMEELRRLRIRVGTEHECADFRRQLFNYRHSASVAPSPTPAPLRGAALSSVAPTTAGGDRGVTSVAGEGAALGGEGSSLRGNNNSSDSVSVTASDASSPTSGAPGSTSPSSPAVLPSSQPVSGGGGGEQSVVIWNSEERRKGCGLMKRLFFARQKEAVNLLQGLLQKYEVSEES